MTMLVKVEFVCARCQTRGLTPEIPLSETLSLASGDLALPCPKCHTPVSILVTPWCLRTEARTQLCDLIQKALAQMTKRGAQLEVIELPDGRVKVQRRAAQPAADPAGRGAAKP